MIEVYNISRVRAKVKLKITKFVHKRLLSTGYSQRDLL